jgi:hypothetical protein
MAKSGFIISPLIENTSEFGMLYGANDLLGGKKVKSFSIAPVGGRRLWNERYEVTFKQVRTPTALNILKMYKLDTIVDGVNHRKISHAEN